MNLTDIKKEPLSRRRARRVGRGTGSGWGRTAGRGLKGQSVRSGGPHKTKQLFDGGTTPLFRRLPKRGFSNARYNHEWLIINIEQLNVFAEGAEVNLNSLIQHNLLTVHKSKKNIALKLLGDGELKVQKLKVHVDKITPSAKEKLEKAQGTVDIIRPKIRRKKWVKKTDAKKAQKTN
jgi:large subunit ribosomal protein L15